MGSMQLSLGVWTLAKKASETTPYNPLQAHFLLVDVFSLLTEAYLFYICFFFFSHDSSIKLPSCSIVTVAPSLQLSGLVHPSAEPQETGSHLGEDAELAST